MTEKLKEVRNPTRVEKTCDVMVGRIGGNSMAIEYRSMVKIPGGD